MVLADGRTVSLQITVRKDSVLFNADKKDKYKILPITRVTYDESMFEEIKKIMDNKDECLVLTV